MDIQEMTKNQKVQNTDHTIVLKVEQLKKKFCRNIKRSMLYGINDLANGLIGFKKKSNYLRKDEFWALDDINFELKKGEILGIIGANGSGKSTLLRLLTGIFPPDQGNITIDGTLGGIIALGAGMHPHMTGRENIYLNGTILGMTKSEIDSQFDSIVDFADLGEFLEAPLSTYNSGMQVRLGFAVAIHGNPDILLVDEVLAVGDVNFRQKSMRKMSEIIKSGKSVIFISHNLPQVQSLCKRVLLLDKGKLLMDGPVDEVVSKYYELQGNTDFIDKPELVQTEYFEKYTYKTFNELGEETDVFKNGDNIKIVFDLKSNIRIENAFISFAFAMDSMTMNTYCNIYENIPFTFDGDSLIELNIKGPHLTPGAYHIYFSVWDETLTYCYLWEKDKAGKIYFKDDGKMLSRFMFDHQWKQIK